MYKTYMSNEVTHSKITKDQLYLYMFYVGGSAPGSLIEVHDIRFVLAERVEDAYPVLIKSWWGVPKGFHLDCWGKLTWVDGYRLCVKETPYTGPEKLYFLNMGGYDAKLFTELHDNRVVVATSEAEAKKRGLKDVLSWSTPHKDNLCEVEKIVCVHNAVQAAFEEKLLYIHLEKDEIPQPFEFTCKYRRLV